MIISPKHKPAFKLWTAIFTSILVVMAYRGSGSAHEVEPTSTTPSEGAILQEAPTQVQLIYSEELNESGSSIQVFDERGKSVDQGNGGVDLNDPMHASLVAGLDELPESIVHCTMEGDATRRGCQRGVILLWGR
jgi:methionine-rich copper-binding protein CopC